MIAAAPRRPDDPWKSGKRRYAGDGKRGDRHGPEGVGHVLAQPTHVPHVLLAAQAVDDGACGQKQQRLEESVGHQVEDAAE